MNFEELVKELKLNTNAPLEDNLASIHQWCEQNISRDIHFDGEKKQAYERYMQLAKYYLEEIEPSLPDYSSESKSSEGSNMTKLVQLAAEKGFDRVLLALAPDKTAVNQPNEYSMTPLHIAAVQGYYHTVKALFALGADPESVNKNKQTPLFSALFLPISADKDLKERKTEIFKLLKNESPETLTHVDKSGDSVLHLIAAQGYASLIDEVLQLTPRLLDISNNHGHYPVHTAILNNQIDCLRIFLTKKGVEDLADSSGEVALHYAGQYGSKETVALCCKAYKNIDLPDSEGRTPLMLAARAGNTDAMQILVEHGADVNLRDNYGSSLLHHAVHYDGTESVRWVLNNAQINVNHKNDYQQTALQICEDQGQDNKIKLLLENGASHGSASNSM